MHLRVKEAILFLKMIKKEASILWLKLKRFPEEKESAKLKLSDVTGNYVSILERETRK